MQRKLCMVPCSSMTCEEPARWCSPSMFCVTTTTFGSSFSSSAMARCPALGSAAAATPKRCSYQLHTKAGSLRYASGVASSIGSYFAQRPVSGSRKVAMPDSLLTPAPVNTTSRVERATARAALCSVSSG